MNGHGGSKQASEGVGSFVVDQCSPYFVLSERKLL